MVNRKLKNVVQTQNEIDRVIFSGDSPIQLKDTVWEDLPVAMNTAVGVGVNQPTWKIFRNDGNVGTAGKSMRFNAQYANAQILNYTATETTNGNLSLSLWVKSYQNQHDIIRKGGMWSLRRSYTSIVFNMNGQDIWINNAIVSNSPTHIGVRVEKQNSLYSNVQVVINGVSVYDNRVWNNNLTTDTSDIVIGSEDGKEYLFDIDELHIYNIGLSVAQLTELYNNGDGTTSVPTGVTEANELVARFHFDSLTDNDNDSTLGAGEDLIRNGTIIEADPLITTSGTTGSFGVLGEAWESGVHSAKFFMKQMKHKKKLGTDLYPHFHYSVVQDGTTGDVAVFELEYTWSDLSSGFPVTIVDEMILDLSDKTAYDHRLTMFSSIDFSTESQVSSMITCRLSRRGDDTRDTFSGDVFIHEFDFHIEVDSAGSDEQFIKFNNEV